MQYKDSYMKNEPSGNKGMLEASYYGGKAINITGTTAGHAMCYNITMNCHTAHGHSVASGLVEIWKYMLSHNENVNDSRGRKYVLNVFDEIGVMLGGKNAADGQRIFASLVDEFKLEKPTASADKIDEFVSKVNVARLGNNPTTLTSNDVAEIYKGILL